MNYCLVWWSKASSIRFRCRCSWSASVRSHSCTAHTQSPPKSTRKHHCRTDTASSVRSNFSGTLNGWSGLSLSTGKVQRRDSFLFQCRPSRYGITRLNLVLLIEHKHFGALTPAFGRTSLWIWKKIRLVKWNLRLWWVANHLVSKVLC